MAHGVRKESPEEFEIPEGGGIMFAVLMMIPVWIIVGWWFLR